MAWSDKGFKWSRRSIRRSELLFEFGPDSNRPSRRSEIDFNFMTYFLISNLPFNFMTSVLVVMSFMLHLQVSTMSLEPQNELELPPLLLDDETFSQLTSLPSQFPSEYDDSISPTGDIEATFSTSFLRQRPVRSWIYQHGTLIIYKGKHKYTNLC